MMRRFIGMLSIVLCLVILISCSGQDNLNNINQNNDTTSPNESSESETGSGQNAPDIPVDSLKGEIKEQIAEMTLEEKIGQMVLVGMEGTETTDQIKQLLEKYHAGGIILFQKNINGVDQTLQLVNNLKETNKGNIPLFFGVDQEGGRVSRMPDEIVSTPASQVIGEVEEEAFSYAIGEIIGRQVSSLGLNMDFAPVLDINSNPDNPVIGDRSFGSTVEAVQMHGIQVMKGLQAQEVIPVVKHFPGHGDTGVDSHLDVPVVNKSLDQLKAFELIPFVDAIDQQADAVMIAHILLTQIDKDNPATLSKAVVTELLRNQLHFEGVIITDDMTMGAITEHYDIGEAAVQAVNAGNDIIMVAHDYDKQVKVFDALTNAVNQGLITENAVDSSVYRILTLKQKYDVTNEKVERVDVEQINTKLESLSADYR